MLRYLGMKPIHAYQKFYPAGIAFVAVIAGFLAIKLAGDAGETPRVSSGAPTAPASPRGAQDSTAQLTALIAARMQHEPPASSLRLVYRNFGDGPVWMKSKIGTQRRKDLAHAAAKAEEQAVQTTRLAHLLMNANDTNLEAEDAAKLDIALTQESLRLAQALRLGVVPRETLGRSWILPADTFDPVSGLSAALDKSGGLKSYLNTLVPADPQYQDLVAALQTYRDIVERGGWPEIPGTEELVLDMTDPRTPLLQERLIGEGYLPGRGLTDTAVLTEAVKQFQSRNGLEPDGRVGKGTLAALNVPAHDRVKQIAANLERWRHTPRDRGDKFIAVNAASTTLDFMINGESVLRMNVVAGAKRHATPIMTAPISAVVLNPDWSIPPSIARNEILPKLKDDPDYLAKNNMVVVETAEHDPYGYATDWHQYETGRNVPVRFRQRPGNDNALGQLKFQMTNPQNIYLHDTPSRSAFSKAQRHLSHGCIRVESPATLAEFVLLETGGWDEATITAEIQKGKPRSIALAKPLPVYIYYWTAFSDDGLVNFRTDIYNRDAPIIEALGIDPAPVHQAKVDRARKVASN